MSGFADLVKASVALAAGISAANDAAAKTPAILDRVSGAAGSDVDRLSSTIESMRDTFEKKRAEIQAYIDSLEERIKEAPTSAVEAMKLRLKEAHEMLTGLIDRGDRTSGLVTQLEAAKGRESSIAGTPGAAITPEVVEPFRVNQILGQMRAVNAAVVEAHQTIEALSETADEVSADVQFKIGKALALILDPGKGEGVSGKFDKDTGQFLGGAFSFEGARDLVDRYIELQAAQKTAKAGAEQFYVNEALKQTAAYFRSIFGPQLGDIKNLAKQLTAYLAATAKEDQRGSSSGTLGRPPARSTATVSLAVLRWSGSLPR